MVTTAVSRRAVNPQLELRGAPVSRSLAVDLSWCH